MFVVEKESRWDDISKVTWKNTSVHGLSGADNDQGVREPAVDREILPQGWGADFWTYISKLLEIQRRNLSSCDLRISNDDLVNPNKKEGSFQF